MEITEDDTVDYIHEDQLSFAYDSSDYVELYVNDEYEGFCKIWHDSEQDDKEYIIINHTIMYLSRIREREDD
jgi:hypothetical protein